MTVRGRGADSGGHTKDLPFPTWFLTVVECQVCSPLHFSPGGWGGHCKLSTQRLLRADFSLSSSTAEVKKLEQSICHLPEELYRQLRPARGSGRPRGSSPF